MLRQFIVTSLLLLAFQLPIAFAEPAKSLLQQLPKVVHSNLSPLFLANAIGQTGLNGQIDSKPDKLLNQLRDTLTKLGYQERTINTVVGQWGFNLVMQVPDNVTVDGTPSGKIAALVLQATAIAPGRLNLNVRFDAI